MSLSPEAQRTLVSVLDTILPPSTSGDCAGAGALGLAGHIENTLAASPELLPMLMAGLAAAEAAARSHGAGHFDELTQEARQQVLEEISSSEPGLLPTLTFHGYVGYYQHPDVMRALGLEARPPHPMGFEVETGDLGLLDPVRARPKLYRV